MRTNQDYEATIGMVRALKACATLSLVPSTSRLAKITGPTER